MRRVKRVEKGGDLKELGYRAIKEMRKRGSEKKKRRGIEGKTKRKKEGSNVGGDFMRLDIKRE